MGSLILDCPHCFKDNVFFRQAGFAEYTGLEGNEKHQCSVFFTCGNCEKAVTATMVCLAKKSPGSFDGNFQKTDKFIVIDTYPKREPVLAPENTPDLVGCFYREAVTDFRAGAKNSAVLMCGKVLETVCRELSPDFTGDLYHRIEHLADAHILPAAMKEWAHELRLVRNQAAHSLETVNPLDAKDMMSFTELFLIYIYTLPGMLAERRQNRTVK